MRANEIELGGVYLVRVSGRDVPVRIMDTMSHGGWFGVTLESGRGTRILSAGRIKTLVRLGTPPTYAERQALLERYAEAVRPEPIDLVENKVQIY
ncbi:MAG: hypothetical protein V3S01_00860 [Dehalococcoidia bacterium]